MARKIFAPDEPKITLDELVQWFGPSVPVNIALVMLDRGFTNAGLRKLLKEFAYRMKEKQA